MKSALPWVLLLSSGFPAVSWAVDETGQKIVASDAESGAQFGHGMAVDGSTLLVGATRATVAGSSSGAVYVLDALSGQELRRLGPSDPKDGQLFGAAVASSRLLALVGAPDDDELGAFAGAAYLFDHVTGHHLHKFTASDGATHMSFGASVAIAGQLAVIGAPNHFRLGSGSTGAVYVFDTFTGLELFTLFPSDGVDGDRFGASVAIEGSTIAVGAPFEGDSPDDESGAVYLFDALTGIELGKVTPPIDDAGGRFGSSLAFRDHQLAIGAPDVGSTFDSKGDGAAFVYDVPTRSFVHQFFASDGTTRSMRFGVDVSMSDEFILVAAPGAEEGRGRADLFDRATGSLVADFVGREGDAFEAFALTVGMGEHNAFCGNATDDDAASFAGSITRFGSRWTDLGFGLGGSAGVPSLIGTGRLEEGANASLDLTSAAPNAFFFLVLGLTQAPTSFAGGTLVPSPDFILTSSTDAAGSAQFSALFPPGVAPCTAFYSQCWIVDPLGPQGFAASNAVEGVTPPF